jgi:hypothetical protein
MAKLFAWGEEDSERHVLCDTTSRGSITVAGEKLQYIHRRGLPLEPAILMFQHLMSDRLRQHWLRLRQICGMQALHLERQPLRIQVTSVIVAGHQNRGIRNQRRRQ